MDFGKLAYVKAEEAERYIRKKASEEAEERCVSIVCVPHAELSSGYIPVRISGNKSVGVMASVRVSAVAAVSAANVRAECGGKLCAATTVTLNRGEECRFTLFFSAYPGSGEYVRLISDESGLILEEVNFMVTGAGAKITSSAVLARADYFGSDLYVIYEKNGYVELTSVNKGITVDVAHGSTFDIAVTEGGVCVAVSDDSGNTLGILYDLGLKELNRKYVGAKFDRIAIARNTGGLVMAGIRNSKLYVCYFAEDFSDGTEWEETDFVSSADDVYFSKQTDNATLFIRRGDGVYAKLAVPAHGDHSSLKLNCTATFE